MTKLKGTRKLIASIMAAGLAYLASWQGFPAVNIALIIIAPCMFVAGQGIIDLKEQKIGWGTKEGV